MQNSRGGEIEYVHVKIRGKYAINVQIRRNMKIIVSKGGGGKLARSMRHILFKPDGWSECVMSSINNHGKKYNRLRFDRLAS